MKLIENWFSERYSENLQLSFRVSDQLLSVKTDYQRIDVFDTYDFGKLLSIDGTVQLTEKDEFVYHEMITMFPYYYAERPPRKALVIGGGDGGVAGQLLSLGVESITNIEIDNQVVEVCKKYFPDLADSFRDPKVDLRIEDGIKYMKSSREKFDLIVVDSTDPEGPAEGLFGLDFYRDVKEKLSPGGIVVAQSGSPFYQPKALKMAYNSARSVFRNSIVYTAFIPTYPSGFWSFTMSSDDKLEPRGTNIEPGKYFNSSILKGAPELPEFVKKILSE
ncbi:MAG: polyamine aminopropyltransferase [Thermoplasmataceae archaeon]